MISHFFHIFVLFESYIFVLWLMYNWRWLYIFSKQNVNRKRMFQVIFYLEIKTFCELV